MHRLALLALLCAVAACGGSKPSESTTPPPGTTDSTPPPTNTCADYQKAAIDSLTTALETYRACKSDADCTTVGFGGSCIDACSRAIAVADMDAFSEATADVDRTQCKAYADAGCPKPEAPPCAPPSTPHCNANRCE